jgi:hypothetical protein
MIPTLALGNVHDLFVGGLIAVRAAIDMETRRIEMGEHWRQPQTRGRRGGNEAREFGHPSLVQRIEGTPERVIVQMACMPGVMRRARGLFWKKWGTR